MGGMFAFHGVDYMEIDALFSDQEKLVRQTVREFKGFAGSWSKRGRPATPHVQPGIGLPL